MKPELFKGSEFFPNGVPVSTFRLSLEELDHIGVSSPKSTGGADESKDKK